MKKNLLLSLLLMLIMQFAFQNKALAVEAYPFPVKYKQPDGTVVTVVMKGDEKVRWAETVDGYSLLRNKKGGFEYGITDRNGDLVCSGVLAKEVNKRTSIDNSVLQKIRKKLSFSKSQIGILKQVAHLKSAQIATGFPKEGTINVLLILMEFQDVHFTKTKTDFENLMNQANYNGTGSFKDFYSENSYGKLTINTTVAGIYTADNEMAYYGTNTPTDDYGVQDLITEAVTKADADVNYANFDNDHDGKVDGIYVIYAGYGEEAGGGSNLDAIWAHASSISPLTLDGTQVSKYACSCELRGNGGSDITAIGVICHEFGHSLGAPDYYDTNYDTDGQYSGTDTWDVMAGGSWNNDGDIPAQHNPYTKSSVYHWATTTVISSKQNVTLRDATTHPDIVQINTTTSNEYFLCENRQKNGFNSSLPGHGMIIYHVDGDYIASHDFDNDINASAHQGMYVVSASATTGTGVMQDGDINTSDCPWPGTGGKTTFDDTTTPNSKSWAGNNTSKAILNIAENGGNITFCLIGCDENAPTNLTATAISTSQINLAWNLNSNSNPVMIAVNTVNSFGTPTNGTSYSAGNTIAGGGTVIYNGGNTAFNHTLLSPATTYYYKVWSVISGNAYSAGILGNASTLCIPSTLPFAETFSATSIPGCWSQVDHEGNGQVWKFGTTSSKNFSTPALTGNYAYLNSDAYGDGNTQNVDLVTPTLDLSGYSSVNMYFNHYFEIYDGGDATLFYSVDNGTNWTLIQQWNSTTGNPEVFNQVVSAVAGKSQVKFKWNYSATYQLVWAIDNISITGVAKGTWTGVTNSDWNESTNWAGGSVPTSSTDVIIPTGVPNYPVIAATTTANCNNLTVDSGASLTIQSSASNTGSLIVSGTSSGTVTAESYISGSAWHILSPIVSGGSISAFIQAAGNAIPSKSGSYGMMDYNETTNLWKNYYTAVTAETLTSGKGYSIRRTANGTVTFSGTLTSGIKTVNLTKAGEGWNCVGNPYASAIKMNDAAGTNNFLAGNSADLDGSYACIYVWDQDASGYKILANSSYGTRDLLQNVLQSGQGFFIKAASATSTISFTTAMQVHSTGTALKSAETTWPGFELTASASGVKASTVVAFNEKMTKGLDPTYDAGLLRGTNGLSLYTKLIDDNGVDFAIQCLPENGMESFVIPVGLDAKAGGEVKLSATTTGLPTGSSVILEDRTAKVYTDLSNGDEYAVTLSGNSSGTGRFYIHTSNLTTGTSGLLPTSGFRLKAYPANGIIWIDGQVSSAAKAYLFNTSGSNLGVFNLQEGNRNSIPASDWQQAFTC